MGDNKKIKDVIKAVIGEYLNEQEDIGAYIGDTFDIQERTAENTVKSDEWGNAQQWRDRFENAGDILRELSSRGSRPDVRYIDEKVVKIENWINKTDFTPIPDEIKTLEDFNKTSLRWTNAVDSWEYLIRFHSSILNKLINDYLNVPVYSKETLIAKNLVLSLMKNDREKIFHYLNEIKRISAEIKKTGAINFSPINSEIKS